MKVAPPAFLNEYLKFLFPVVHFLSSKMSKKTVNPAGNFFKDRLGELNNVTWPTQRQAIHSMILVLVIMLLVGIFLGFVDYGLNEIVLSLLG